MSRSWERMVRRNRKQINKRRKKEGKQAIGNAQVERFRGRSYILPLFLVLMAALFVVVSRPWEVDQGALFWWTVAAYAALALLYFLRRPYLAVGRDWLETRRFTGYKTLKASEIRKIILLPGYVIVESVKGSRWVFSRAMNLYPIGPMSERLRKFAQDHRIDVDTSVK